jgi:hypothetical protein
MQLGVFIKSTTVSSNLTDPCHYQVYGLGLVTCFSLEIGLTLFRLLCPVSTF